MNTASANKPINTYQLKQELGGVDLVVRHRDGGVEVEAATDQASLDAALGAHVADDSIGPVDPDRQAFRDAVASATSVAALRDAILGTTTGVEPEVRR